MTDPTTKWEQLQAPFPTASIGRKPTANKCRDCADLAKQKKYQACNRHTWLPNCPECKSYHSSAMLHVDYVGHAITTNRLLNVDPEWTWEPMGYDQAGLPLVQGGYLWIKLTVLGVTRPGVGEGKNPKEMIGNAIRNAAMRFGVALDLWAKEELESAKVGIHDDEQPEPESNGQEPIPDPVTGEVPLEDGDVQVRMMSKGQMITLKTLEKTLGMDGEGDRERRLAFYAWMTGRVVNSSKELTQDEADLIIVELRSREQAQAQT